MPATFSPRPGRASVPLEAKGPDNRCAGSGQRPTNSPRPWLRTSRCGAPLGNSTQCQGPRPELRGPPARARLTYATSPPDNATIAWVDDHCLVATPRKNTAPPPLRLRICGSGGNPPNRYPQESGMAPSPARSSRYSHASRGNSAGYRASLLTRAILLRVGVAISWQISLTPSWASRRSAARCFALETHARRTESALLVETSPSPCSPPPSHDRLV